METTLSAPDTAISVVHLKGEPFFKISNHDTMRPFFMSIVSSSNHWMFISSNGGLSAGRKNAENALFPYYTDDKITESADITGSKTIFQVRESGNIYIWEPFSYRYEGKYQVSRNIYKNTYGNKILFEETNHDLQLTFRYQWNSSDAFGFVKKSELLNYSDKKVEISMLDGIQNLVPYGVGSYLQNNTSNLVDAYKRNELDRQSGLGIFALSAIIVDKAEPSEALKANVAWSLGLDNAQYLLSSLQLDNFRKGQSIRQEEDVKAEKGAYFIQSQIVLTPGADKSWMIIADVNKNHAAVCQMIRRIGQTPGLAGQVQDDIDKGTQDLIKLNAASDGLQLTADHLRDTRHFSNTLFNIMRGGIFDDNYTIEKKDFSKYLANANKNVYRSAESILAELPESFSFSRLRAVAMDQEDTHFTRLCLEYMPLKFSRRHGDPSRPWNVFSINTRDEEDGSKILDYQGNWRDIFQNWEALVQSYPDFVESMIHKFLNATTFDGYNPYRVTKDGFDWETIEPDDPWSYIGYWGDHQIIYLLKLLEFMEKRFPGKLEAYFDQSLFIYANVPYKIKSYEDILQNPKDTIDFDLELDEQIRKEREGLGADAALCKDQQKEIYRVNFIEKILASVLAKVSNFIPEGGIWMNTQRPEWNDANNALVGNGVSMVTLYYLRRYLHFFKKLFEQCQVQEISISTELHAFFERVMQTFDQHKGLLSGAITDADKKLVLDGLGKAGSDYRMQIYQHHFSGKKQPLSLQVLQSFADTTLRYLEHSIDANRRADGLYHAYNLMTYNEEENSITISYLSEMLEGQVAVLSAGYLSSGEVLRVLDTLKSSQLFREDQYSYLLYPNKALPGFLERNNIPAAMVTDSSLLSEMVANNDKEIVEQDVNGQYHFNGNFRNAKDLKAALERLSQTKYASKAAEEKKQILQVFEKVFNHKAFTGRSGTFYGYEGLGSIYWHMVSKLRLAVQECCLKAVADQEPEILVGKLLEHYYEIDAGIGVHKSPQLYGAFPTDPYSHTPFTKGAQQPGMTGQVKEDILSRFGELGVFIRDGQLCFDPSLLRVGEFLDRPKTFEFINVNGAKEVVKLDARSLVFTFCQVPVIYRLADSPKIEVFKKDDAIVTSDTLSLDKTTSEQIFQRAGAIKLIVVFVPAQMLK